MGAQCTGQQDNTGCAGCEQVWGQSKHHRVCPSGGGRGNTTVAEEEPDGWILDQFKKSEGRSPPKEGSGSELGEGEDTEGGVWGGRGMSVRVLGVVLCSLLFVFPFLSPGSMVEPFSYSCCW